MKKNKLVKILQDDLIKRVLKKKQEDPNFNDVKYVIRYIWTLIGIWVGSMVAIFVF